MMQPAGVGCLQVQPIDPVDPGADMQSEVGRKQVPIVSNAAPAAVDPLRERFLLSRPTRASREARRAAGEGRLEEAKPQNRRLCDAIASGRDAGRAIATGWCAAGIRTCSRIVGAV